MALQIKKEKYIDPVCGMKVISGKAAAKTNYQGVQIYFCTTTCKSSFDADPKRFMQNRRKSFWNRYLDRLNKATGGKPPSCCS